MNRLLISIAALTLCLAACSNDDGNSHDHDHGPANMMAEPGAPSAKLVLHVEGRSIDGEPAPLANASIYLSEHTGTEEEHHHHPEGEPSAVTAENGDVTLPLIPNKAYVVHVEADGYDGVVRLVQQAVDTERNLWLTLHAQQKTTVTVPEEGSVDVTLGNTVGGTISPVTLTIEANDLGAQNGEGEAVNGDIELTYGSWDPAVDDASSLPSDLRTADGPLVSYGMFHVEFRQGDEVLNVRDGQTIAWTMQINEALRDMAEQAAGVDALNIYSLDHNSGLWVEDDVARSYEAETGIMTTESTHFSHKNCDGPGPWGANSCIDVQVVDERGNSIRAADISIAGRGGARAGCNDIPCTINGRAARQVSYTASARAHVINGRWVSGRASVGTTCDDINVGCGMGGNCAAARIVLPMCHLDDEPCVGRDDCCDDGQDRACRLPNGAGQPGVCGACVPEGQTCVNSEECCNGLSCTDFQCFAN